MVTVYDRVILLEDVRSVVILVSLAEERPPLLSGLARGPASLEGGLDERLLEVLQPGMVSASGQSVLRLAQSQVLLQHNALVQEHLELTRRSRVLLSALGARDLHVDSVAGAHLAERHCEERRL